MNSLELKDFGAVRRGRALAQPLTITLEPGTVLGIVGPNGVGKSSLIGALAGAGVKHYGEASYAGRQLCRIGARERASIVALLAQDLAAPDELRVRELVAVGARAAGARGAGPFAAAGSGSGTAFDPDAAAMASLTAVGIERLANDRYGALSGGQKQLVQIARVLAQDTPIVLLDEPTSALDLFHQRAVAQTMRRLGNDGRIVITAVHDLTLALNTCTRILLLDRDGGAHTGVPHEVLSPELVYAAYGVETAIHTTAHGRQFLGEVD